MYNTIYTVFVQAKIVWPYLEHQYFLHTVYHNFSPIIRLADNQHVIKET